jgi:hypothetical protein
LRGGRCGAPVRLVDQERRAKLDRQGHGRSFTGIQLLGAYRTTRSPSAISK